MYSSTEEWQTGVRLDGTQVPTTANFQAIDSAVQTFLSTSQARLPAGFRYIGLKWAPQDVNGRYGDNGESVEYLAPAPLSGSTTPSYPQVAVVLSLRTGRARGFASNGRMYFPTMQSVQSDSGKMTAGTASGLATAGAALIQAINAVGLGNVAVMSAVGAGRIERVTGVRVGRVFDTQRRRRNGLAEEYSAPAAVPS
jgi:hypothetical protein